MANTCEQIMYLMENVDCFTFYHKLFKGLATRIYVTAREVIFIHFIHLSSTACMEYLYMPGVKNNQGVVEEDFIC